MRVAPFLIALTCSNVASAQASTQPIVLKPAGDWVLDYAENHCRIVRRFESEGGGKQSLFYFQQTDPKAGPTWLVAGPAVPKSGKLTIQFGPDNEPMESREIRVEFGEFKSAIMGGGFKPSQEPWEDDPSSALKLVGTIGNPSPEVSTGGPDWPVTVRWMDISTRSGTPVRIPLAEMPQIADAMKTCMDDLVRSWGAEPELQAQVATHAMWTNRADVSQRIVRYYPSTAVARGEQANLMLRITIEADGTPSKCVRVDLTKAANFDNFACVQIMKHGIFEPARNAQGQAMRSFITQAILYTMPD